MFRGRLKRVGFCYIHIEFEAVSPFGDKLDIEASFIERLWRTVKYEHVYLHAYDSVQAVWCGLNNYFKFYNEERLHTSLNTRTPHEVYFQKT